MSYVATVAKIQSLTPHPNADRIQLAKVLGEQVVVGLDVKVDDVGIYFPVDGQLSHEFCLNNYLYNSSARKALGYDGNGPVGFFDHNRRVRTQKFRGEKSEGFWIPLTTINVAFTGGDLPLFGQSFDAINGVSVCNKYETQATKNARQNGPKAVKRGETRMFKKHFDTDQFRHKWEEIPEGSIIYLTEKLHGTSGRYGYVKDEPISSLVRMVASRVLKVFGYEYPNWTYLMGTRNVIVGRTDGEGFYGSDQFRSDAVKDLELRKGEVIYFELVGDVSAGSSIMAECKVDKKELPEIFAQYGDTMRYRYGCKDGKCKLFVYRIVQMNEDGQSVELSWPQVKKRCHELNLQHVPEIEWTRDYDEIYQTFFWPRDAVSREECKKAIEELSHGPSLLDTSHIREGVAIRVETPDGRIYTLKEKSFEFKFLEGIVKSSEVVDLEEAS